MLGYIYNNLKDFSSGFEEHKKAPSMRERLLGNHEDTAQSHYVLGCTYNDLADFNSAHAEHKKALSMREKLLGDH